ncbi:SDR family NAD(P)-dependent oxidoreductase [Candidatus Micrarchaeota archaeon]|nr:SDR family NAD(P)-dependent oxidoreductase [Candidatus Micrarchaeota archaeon]MBU1930075.1 SDR family NAD(P)-dependent oxidoreductase [Candidatus Micrarchaeota archaeon]
MTILVTGAAGFIGSHLADLLIAHGQHVLAMDTFDNQYSPLQKNSNIQHLLTNKNFELIVGDIRNKELVEKVFARNQIEKVVHLAANAGVRYSIENPAECADVNINGTLRILEASRKNKIKQFVFASSSSVYGNPTVFPTKETDNTETQVSPYATTKKCGEIICKNYNYNYGIPVTCLRFFTSYGPRNRSNMAVYKFGEAIFEQKPLQLFGNGDAKRDYTYVKDVAESVLLALDKDLGFEVLNIGSHCPVTLTEVIRALEKFIGKKAIIEHKPYPSCDPLETFADVSKAKKTLHWEPKTSIQEGLKAFVQWYAEKENTEKDQ